MKNKQNGLKCNKRKCIALKSSGNIFSKRPFYICKMNFDLVIDILYLFFIGVKNKQIKVLMGISKTTVSKIIRSSLKLIRNYVRLNQQLLGGDEVIVEGDESLFGQRKYN
ncbi:hypothetical protein COBT_002678 [Conglomerata obtusa]